MKKFLLFLLLVAAIKLNANPVDSINAQKAALNFLQKNIGVTNVNTGNLKLTYKLVGNQVLQTEETLQLTYLYIFNYANGFVIVSGDDCAKPILGYSSQGKFDTSNFPTNMRKWLEDYKNQIRYGIELKLSDTETKEEWNRILSTTITQQRNSNTQSVLPLLQTTWNQSPFYNALCPFDNQYNDRTVTGCVATAMAQIMKYWNYPTVGTGFYSYNHPKYGNLSANFGATTYQWASMPNTVNSANSAVATLMYHCGVSVNMLYNVGSQGGSSAQTLDVANALKQYFGYDNSVQGLYRTNFTLSQWNTILQTELNSSRPIQYAGTGNGGGHSFVCDGYDVNNYYHFNWGWAGNADGYFSLDALNPGSLGTGGGTGGFNTNQRAIVGIKPPNLNPVYSLRLYNSVTPSSSTISYTQPFTITTNIANVGTGTFNGDYCAAVFDNSNTFVGYVEIKTAQSLQNGYAYTNNLVFSNTGMAGMMPGTYTVGIYSRPTGGTQWTLVSNYGSYTNFPTITVTYNNDIALNSTINTTPATLVKGQSASINLNIKNVGSSTFTGKYYTALYNLDGSFAQLLDSLNETAGLPSNYTYSSPYLTFNNSSINVNAGSYLLATLHRPNSTGTLQLTGANSFQNPRKVIVKNPDITPDIYEVNDNVSQAYSLPVSFTGNNILINTNGSNCNVGTDYDYYKITLPSGFNYTLKPRLQDSYNSNNGNTYTLDALFSYSFNGSTWSEAYDDTLTSNIIMNNGGTLYIAVSPYFTGSIGTYLLQIQISRTSTLPVTYTMFNATLKDKTVHLDWHTSTEINSDYFSIERSLDSREFREIGKVKAAFNSSGLKDYRFIDSTPMTGRNYYRIKQVDFDGKFSFSEIKSISISSMSLVYSIVPNPAKNFITLSFDKPQRQYNIIITDMQGKIVHVINNPSAIYMTQHKIDLSNIPNGIYLVSVMTNNGNYTQKLLINR